MLRAEHGSLHWVLLFCYLVCWSVLLCGWRCLIFWLEDSNSWRTNRQSKQYLVLVGCRDLLWWGAERPSRRMTPFVLLNARKISPCKSTGPSQRRDLPLIEFYVLPCGDWYLSKWTGERTGKFSFNGCPFVIFRSSWLTGLTKSGP